jgi:hypothetical protein
MLRQVLQALFKGVDFTKHHKCAIIDLVPYDATLPQAVMELQCSENNELPSMSVCSILWTGNADDRRKLQEWIYTEIRNTLYLMVTKHRIKLPGLVQEPMANAADEMRPTYKEEDYTYTKPQENNLLPLLQSVQASMFFTNSATIHVFFVCTLDAQVHTLIYIAFI